MPVATTQYPSEQMHRISYTNLTERQIENKLAAAADGPASASPPSQELAGTSLEIVADSGLSLSYSFAGANRLTLAENGGAVVEAGYAAHMLGRVVFFAHVVPGTQKGYNVVVDRDTNIATVFEIWFSGYEDKREVQREIHYGYVDTGSEPPEARHAITNRIEGKGFYFRQDTGVETLEFYPSTIYSNFVELTRLGGELGFCAPTDYLQIDDELYIYQRTECEFSGIMTMYVLDVNRIEQVGMRLGFDAADELEYYVFRGSGEMLGQLAHFEPFGETGTTAAPEPPTEKGERRVYRPMETNPIMTEAEVEQAIAENTSVFAEDSPMAGNKLPVSDYLAGRRLTLRYDDGTAVEYRFDDARTLRWRREGERMWREERYESWESAPGVVMFGHLLSGAPAHDCHIVVADFDEALATCIRGTMGTPYIANEAAAETLHGVVEMEGITPPKYRRHEFTDELLGSALTWNYSPGLTSMHLYSTPHSLSWIIFGQNGSGGMEWSGPAEYTKIRDDIYLVYWLEEACNGTLGTILVNMRTMHDCGVGYHCGPDGLSVSSIGAHSRNAGRFDIARFYGVRGSRSRA